MVFPPVGSLYHYTTTTTLNKAENIFNKKRNTPAATDGGSWGIPALHIFLKAWKGKDHLGGGRKYLALEIPGLLIHQIAHMAL